MEEWLIRLGLEDYWSKFKENSYTEPRDLADLKFMDKETLKANFEITKEGHLSRIFNAVKKLQYPTAGMLIFNCLMFRLCTACAKTICPFQLQIMRMDETQK